MWLEFLSKRRFCDKKVPKETDTQKCEWWDEHQGGDVRRKTLSVLISRGSKVQRWYEGTYPEQI